MKYIMYYDQGNNAIVTIPEAYALHITSSNLILTELFRGTIDECKTFVSGVEKLISAANRQKTSSIDALLNQIFNN